MGVVGTGSSSRQAGWPQGVAMIKLATSTASYRREQQEGSREEGEVSSPRNDPRAHVQTRTRQRLSVRPRPYCALPPTLPRLSLVPRRAHLAHRASACRTCMSSPRMHKPSLLYTFIKL